MDDFLPTHIARRARATFPPPYSRVWKHYESEGGRKLELSDTSFMPEGARQAVEYMNREPRNLFGFDDLFPDPDLYGGGLNMARPGDFLRPHADFNWNDKQYGTAP